MTAAAEVLPDGFPKSKQRERAQDAQRGERNMRTSATMLVLACLALAASPDRGVAQHGPYPPMLGQAWDLPSNGEFQFSQQGPYQQAYPAMLGQAWDLPSNSEFQFSQQGPYQQGPHPPILDEQSVHPVAEQCLDGCCNQDCRGPRVWGSAESLLGLRKSRQVPPLVTTSTPGVMQGQAGVLGLPTTTILFGGDGLERNPHGGLRGEVGVWLDKAARIGVGGSYLDLQEDLVEFSARSDANGNPILARPFFNTLLNQQASQLVAFPAIVSGAVNVQSGNEIYSAEAFLRHQIGSYPITPHLFYLTNGIRWIFYLPGIHRLPGSSFAHNLISTPPLTRLDLLAGYQFNRIDDQLLITNNLVSLDPAFLGQIGTTLDAFDRFDARNEFHGATVGWKSVSQFGHWSLTTLGKVALGHMQQIVTIDGRTVVTAPGGPSVETAGGLLAQPSNIGSFDRDLFAVMPEARIMLSYNLTPRVKVGIGYDFMYWSRIALAGDQVNLQVDVTQNLPDPSFTFRDGAFFVHAVKFQLQLNY